MVLPFDPRQIPILASDLDLKPVASHVMVPPALRARFQSPPIWLPDAQTDRWMQPDTVVQASVLVPLVWRPQSDGAPSVLLTQRTAHLKQHGGQISFPGGRAESYDLDPVATALREAHEEVGLAPERVEVLGMLPRYLTGTGFEVTPVVGLVQALPHELTHLDLRADPHEVDEIFEVPLDFLMNPANHRQHRLDLGGRELSYFSMPWAPSHPREDDYFIWGATAAMLRNFYRFLSA